MIHVGQGYNRPMDPSWDVFCSHMSHDSSNGLVDIFIDKKPLRSLLRLGHEIRLGQKNGNDDVENSLGKQPFSNILKGVGVKIFMR